MESKKIGIFLLMTIMIVLVMKFCFGKSGAKGALPFSHSYIDNYVEDVMNKLHVPGLALAIVNNDQVLFMKGYGLLEVGKAAKVNNDTIFQIGSCSKAFTAAALGILVDEGKISWDDKAHNYLPHLKLYDPYVTKELTIADMLSHRSGVEDIGLIYYKSTASRDELIERLRYFSPKVGFRVSGVYNNLMYLAAGEVIPVVAGITWEQFVADRILSPLGMSRSGTIIEGIAEKGNLAQSHYLDNDEIRQTPLLDLSCIGASGSMHSSVSDLSRWLQMLINKGQYTEGKFLLSKPTIEQMHSPHSIMSPGYPFGLYGLGWGLADHNGYKVVFHKGSLDGATAIVGLIPDKNIGVIVLTNLDVCEAREVIMNHIFDLYLGEKQPADRLKMQMEKEKEAKYKRLSENKKIDESHIIGTVPSLSLDRYVGNYHNDLYGNVVIEKLGESLMCKFLGFAGALSHWHNDTFMFDSALDYPTVGDRFFIAFTVNKGATGDLWLRRSSNKDVIFKKIK